MIDTMKKRKLFFSLILLLAIGVVIGTVLNHSVNADKALARVPQPLLCLHPRNSQSFPRHENS
jgi:hypothetical protein